MEYYDRYEKYRGNGIVEFMPFIPIEHESSDLYIIFEKATMRFDNLSYKYYGDPNYAWLILQANPSIGGYEYSVQDGTTLRIPYPLRNAINRYEQGIQRYKRINEEKP